MKRIGVFDSGIGGLTVLEELKKLLPNEDYLFYADSKNCPYGEKSDTELYDITSNIVDYLIDRDCKIIVIACNTATTRCIKYLRDKYKDMTFIGTEPAIKVACDRDYKNILVMATPATIASERTSILVNDNKKDYENIYLVPCEGLADAIETDNFKKQEDIVSSIYDEYKDKDIDAIVLGCTHYPHIKDLISKYFTNAELLDGGAGVARETKRQLERMNMLGTGLSPVVEIINSLDM
ncbi:MAG: glutamate racemase [Bacilli bacterium]|nr:glutamate racemase [Bacilli bacterium]